MALTWTSVNIVNELDVSEESGDNDTIKFELDPRLKQILFEQGINRLFPLQEALLHHFHPQVVNSIPLSSFARPGGDVCVCAPTGSGKTLAYLLPILHGLRNRKCPRLRALIMVPGRELALQVASIVESLSKVLGLKTGMAIGATSLSTEIRKLVNSFTGISLVDILIATPGRLLDLLDTTACTNFTLEHVEWLVLDEADRLLEGFTQDWLPPLMSALYSHRHPDHARTFRSTLEAPFESPLWVTPLSKLLLSATLTNNPAKLVELHLNNATYMTLTGHTKDIGDKEIRHCTPSGLSEFIYVTEDDRKPIPLLYYLFYNLKGPTLCFTKSVDSTTKLCKLLHAALSTTKLCELLPTTLSTTPQRDRIAAYSAELPPTERTVLLEKFQAGQIDLLICSDAAARGLDLPNVALVINYDAPKHLRTYIHRVGRTARAGKSGQACTILATRQAHYFKEMLKKAGKERISPLRIPKEELISLIGILNEALEQFVPRKDQGL